LIYGLPLVGRHGLGHSLLAWGRCQIWCRDHGATPLAPRWLQPRIGPYLRRERDKRNYFLLFRRGHAIGGVRKAMILATTPQVDEAAYRAETARDPLVVLFRSIADNDVREDFAPLKGQGRWLRRELEAMTRPGYRPKREIAKGAIAIHVRLGDFTVADAEQVARGRQNVRIGIDWYVEALARLRAGLGAATPAILFSDGADRELAPLLAVPGVSRAPRQSAVTDMLSIAGADALIGSGSGFSIWGSLLGEVPRLSASGQQLVRVLASPDAEAELAPGADIPLSFIAAVKAHRSRPANEAAPCAA